jgi:hypothetical protein
MVELGDAVIDTKDRYARVKRIQKLNVDHDYSEIASLFYQDFQPVMVALPFAGFMTTFAAPRMSRILSSTGETEHRFAKRAVDTSLFARASHQCGFASETGREAARRVILCWSAAILRSSQSRWPKPTAGEPSPTKNGKRSGYSIIVRRARTARESPSHRQSR